MRNIYQGVTDKIVKALDQGVTPRIKPCSSSGSMTLVIITPSPTTPSRVVRIQASIYRCSGQWPGCRRSLKIVG